jgi:hypothetical protein
MQYCISIDELQDTMRRKYEHVGYVNLGMSVAACWCGIRILLVDVYIDPLETCRDAISSFYLQITRYVRRI